MSNRLKKLYSKGGALTRSHNMYIYRYIIQIVLFLIFLTKRDALMNLDNKSNFMHLP